MEATMDWEMHDNIIKLFKKIKRLFGKKFLQYYFSTIISKNTITHVQLYRALNEVSKVKLNQANDAYLLMILGNLEASLVAGMDCTMFNKSQIKCLNESGDLSFNIRYIPRDKELT